MWKRTCCRVFLLISKDIPEFQSHCFRNQFQKILIGGVFSLPRTQRELVFQHQKKISDLLSERLIKKLLQTS